MNFQQEYEKAGIQNKRKIVEMTVKRIMDVQRRAKIKPSAYNPVLLNSPMSGGDAMSAPNPLDLYYPS